VLNKIIIHWALLFTGISSAYSQKLVFENLGVKQGLPAMEVYNLFQDQDGYIWIFTEYGIVKHNGSKFIPVCRNIPLKESAIYAVAESKSGALYIANSKARIYEIQNDKAFLVKGLEKYTREVQEASLPICNLFLDNSDGLYFSTFLKTYLATKNHYWVPGMHPTKNRQTLANKIRPLCIFRSGDWKKEQLGLSISDRFGHIKKVLHRDSIYMTRVVSYGFNGNTYIKSLSF